MNQTPSYKDLLNLNKQLQEENQRLKSQINDFANTNQNIGFLDIIPQMVSYVNNDLVYEYVNKAYEDTFNIKANDIVGMKLADFIGKQAMQKAKKHLGKVFNGEDVKYVEKFEYPNNIVKYIAGHLIPDVSMNGKIKGYWAILDDITETKKAQIKLQEGEERFRKSFDTELVALAISRRKDGRYLYTNPGFYTITGYSENELIGKTSKELGFFSTQERKEMLSAIHKYGHLHNQEMTFPTKSGQKRTILFSIAPITVNEEQCLLSTMVDVTERKAVNEKYRNIFDNAPLGIFRSTPDGRFIDMNQSLASLLGYASPEDAIDAIQDIAKQVYVQTNERKDIVDNALNINTFQKFENVYKDRNGKHFIANLYLKAIKDSDGNTRYLEGMVEDITERKKQEEAIKESELKYRKLLEESPVGITLFSDNQVKLMNKKMIDILGYDNFEELKEKSIFDVIHPDDHEMARNRINALKNKTMTYPAHFRYRIITKHGDIKHLAEYLSQFTVNNKKYDQAIVQDVTPIVEAEQSKKRIASEAAYIERKIQLLKKAEDDLKRIIEKNDYDFFEFSSVLQLFKNEIEIDRHWNIFKENFESLHTGFFTKLISVCPKLTQQDLKHCAFIKMNFETKEIAAIFNVKATSVQISRVRLKKKLRLKPEDDLIEFILKL